jgi:hypothetical protein
VQFKANLNAFDVAPRTNAINKASGGIGNMEDSANANKNKAIDPYGVSAQCNTQSYNFLKNFKMHLKKIFIKS